MASVTSRTETRHPPVSTSADLRVSAYDRVSASMVAALILVGFVVLVLFLLWLTMRAYAHQESRPVEIIDELSGRGDHTMGSAHDLEPPGVEDLPELTEQKLTDASEILTNVASNVQGALEVLEGAEEQLGKGSGAGDNRAVGPGGDGPDVVPPWNRWQIQFTDTSVALYAQQLDHFGIELGAIGKGGTVHYAFHFTDTSPKKRIGRTENESRLYMSWRSGRLKDADRSLLANAGVDTTGRILLQFYPKQTEQMLARAEQEHAGNRPVQGIKRTVFEVRSQGADFVFVVTNQKYRVY